VATANLKTPFMPSPKILLPLYTAWLEGRVTKCACSDTSDELYDVGFTCIHHDAVVFRDCFCEYKGSITCQLCIYRQMGDLLKDAHDELSAEEKATLLNSPNGFLDEGPTKLSTVIACMSALLLKREEMAQEGPLFVDVREEDPVAKKIIDEVIALLWLPMVKRRMPCELKSCNCVFNPIARLIAPLMDFDPEEFIAELENEQKECGCKGLGTSEEEEKE